MTRHLFACATIVLFCVHAHAHDPWIETNTAICRVGDAVDVDLKLGNHGNSHRDFKLAGRLSLEWTNFDCIAPDGQHFDLKPNVVETAVAPKEGYWTTRHVLAKSGMYVFTQSMDRVVDHGKKVRAVRSSKVFVLASHSLDKPVNEMPEVAKQPLGLPFEIVFETCPVLKVAISEPVKIRVLKDGSPLAGVRISFIPRGVELAEGFDETYERMTDDQGLASWTPKESTTVLIAAHYTGESEKSADYEQTSYSATATIRVPRSCHCCGDLSATDPGSANIVAATASSSRGERR